MVTRQEEVLNTVPAQLLVIATPEKFALWFAMCGAVIAMLGWGPLHLMPASKMRPSPPWMYMLHSAAAAAAAPLAPVPAAPAPAAAGVAAAGVLPSGCAEVMTASKHDRMASQSPAAQRLAQLQRHDSNSSKAMQLVSECIRACTL
jgi:hypothetical protein